MLFVSQNFEWSGDVGLAVTNGIPVVRSLVPSPAGLSRYPIERFLLVSAVGDAAYLALLVLIATGLVTTVQFVP